MAWPSSRFPSTIDAIVDKVDVTDDVIAADVNGIYDCIEHLEAKLGVDSSAVATSIDYLLKNTSSSNPGHKHTKSHGLTDVTVVAAEINLTCRAANNGFFSSSRKVWLYEDTAPDGWTIVAAAADALASVKGGITTYNVSGGSQAGTWAQPTHYHITYTFIHYTAGAVNTLTGYAKTPITWRPLAQVGIIVSKN